MLLKLKIAQNLNNIVQKIYPFKSFNVLLPIAFVLQELNCKKD